jgi:conjugal transfer pilus assembly protein TraF
MLKLVIGSLFTLMLSTSLFAGWHDRRAEGWAWYEEVVKEEEDEEEDTSSQSTASENLKKIQEELEEVKAKAVLDPTEENVLAYIQLQDQWMQNSTEFAKTWKKVLMSNPNLDQTTKTPVSQYGIQAYKHAKFQDLAAKIKALGETQGMFFFYEGSKTLSQSLSKIVKMFEGKYGWKIFPVSMDGVILPDFPESQINNGIADKLEIKIFPSLFAVDPKKNKVNPIAFGPVSLVDIEKNIILQFEEEVRND